MLLFNTNLNLATPPILEHDQSILKEDSLAIKEIINFNSDDNNNLVLVDL
jgi:hypothetical protein